MSDRKPIPKSVRFEVFKRDSFTCQYCGAKAPEVVLVIDHIKPVSKGGDNDLMNLITACGACNSGKSDRTLDDNTVLAKQRAQIEELNERRQQIEMMLQWRDESLSIEKLKADKVEEIIFVKTGMRPNELGREDIEKWLKRHTFDEVVNAVDMAFDAYFDSTSEGWNKAFNYVPGIIRIEKRSADKPWLRDLYYTRGILRRRLRYVAERDVMGLMERAVAAGIETDEIKGLAKEVRTWSQFRNTLEAWIEEIEHGEN